MDALWFIDRSYMEMDVCQVSIPNSPPDHSLLSLGVGPRARFYLACKLVKTLL